MHRLEQQSVHDPFDGLTTRSHRWFEGSPISPNHLHWLLKQQHIAKYDIQRLQIRAAASPQFSSHGASNSHEEWTSFRSMSHPGRSRYGKWRPQRVRRGTNSNCFTRMDSAPPNSGQIRASRKPGVIQCVCFPSFTETIMSYRIQSAPLFIPPGVTHSIPWWTQASRWRTS